MNYVNTLSCLFAILQDCNASDTDERQPWQDAKDCRQRGGAYGHVREAIVALAGETIVEHWAETGDFDLTLADRLYLAAGQEPAGHEPAIEQEAGEHLARLVRRAKNAIDSREMILKDRIDMLERQAVEAAESLSSASAMLSTSHPDHMRHYAPTALARSRHLADCVQEIEHAKTRLREIEGLRESILTDPRHFA